EVWPLLLL
ncbi:unnamed protein product, partial [Allacma fusca]